MGKLNMNGGSSIGDFFANIIDFLFGSKKRIIISVSVIAILVLSAIFIPLSIYWIKKSNEPKPKEKITITINIELDGNPNESFSNIEVYKTSTNERLYLSTEKSFSITNYDYDFEKDDMLRIQRAEYSLSINGQTDYDLRLDGDNILFLVTGNMNINLKATKILTEQEQERLKSLELCFVDKNGAKITSQIKAMEKNTIPTDIETGELDYSSEEIKILGTSSGATLSKMLIKIDDNQINNLTIFFYSLEYDFEDLDITNALQNESLTLVGTYKAERMEIMDLDNVKFTLKFESKNSNGDIILQDLTDPKAKVNYYFYNLKNNGEIVKGKIDVVEDKNTSIFFNEATNYMFEYMVVNVELNNRYYSAICYPTPQAKAIDVALKEGFKITAKYLSNSKIEVKEGEKTFVVPCDNSGMFTYISNDLTKLSFIDNQTKEVLALVKMDTNGKNIVEVIHITNKNFIYNEAMNNLVLLPQSSVAND